jgi:beta-lactamase superfamily II metal-dependent hydrolase
MPRFYPEGPALRLRQPMLRFVALFTLVATLALAAPAAEASGGNLVISQLYGGGGNAGSIFKSDFIELYNPGTAPVTVTGWTVQYAAAAGTTWQTTAISGVIQPGHYYLVQESTGTGGTTPLPAPDATGNIAMSATAGKVALVTTSAALSGACPAGATILDLVGFGTGVSCFEGPKATPAPANATAVFRAANGCTDTDNNGADFSVAPANPRNSSIVSSCGAPVLPAAPVATATPGNAAVTLSWAPVTGAATYNVKRSTVSGGSHDLIGTTPSSPFTDSSAVNGTTYFYVVSAANSVGEGPDSAEVTATPAAPVVPAAPTALTAVAGNGQVALSWIASAGASTYVVQRSIVSGSGFAQVGTSTTTSFTDRTVTNGTTYFYVVSARNAAGDSAPSSEVSATPQGVVAIGNARIYFIDIGQGASTLIVGPTGKTLLVDGGPDQSGSAVINLLNTLGISKVDFTVLTHYHIDHDAGLIGVFSADRVAGTAYDNGDDISVAPPGTSTSSSSTRGTYLNYVAATNRPGVTRKTIVPGDVIDLGGGMRATCLAAGGKLLGGGSVAISTDDLNSESISLLVEYNDFDFMISGDLTGGGSTTTANTPDVESFAGQLAGDVDVVQLDHHGSTTASSQRYLSALKAEVAVAQAGSTNTFGHPNKETVNKYLNTFDTRNLSFGGTGVPPVGVGTAFYESEPPVSGDTRVTTQAYIGSTTSGTGTLELSTDGTSTYSMKSFTDGGLRINHTFPVDGASSGITTIFPPTVIPSITPAVPLSSDVVTITAQVNPVGSATVNYKLNGTAQTPRTMSCAGTICSTTIDPQPDGTRVDYTVTATSGSKSSSYSDGYFSGITPIASLRPLTSLGEPLFLGYPVRIRGVVTAGTGIFSSGANNDDYIEDATGGINIFRTTDPPTPALQPTLTGNTYDVAGRIGENVGRLRIEVTPPFNSPTTPFTISLLSSGGAPVPTSMSISQIIAAGEAVEGRLVAIPNCTIVGGTIPTSGSSDGFLTIADASGQFTLKVDKDSDVPGLATPPGAFTLVGIIEQDHDLRPFLGSFDITPRFRPDLGAPSSVKPPITIAEARVDDADTHGNPPGDFIPDRLNQTLHVRGVVTSINFRAGATGIEYYVQDATGGLDVFSTSNFPAFSIGDYLDVTGTMTQFNGQDELNPGSKLSNISVATDTPPTIAPRLVTLSQLGNNGAGEAVEGQLVRIDNVTITGGTFPPLGGVANVTIADATGSATMRIVAATDIAGTPAPGGPFSVIGVVGQFATAPFNSGYQLLPRSLADIVLSVAASPRQVAFGSVATGQSASQSVVVTNNGATTLTVNQPFVISGSAQFTSDNGGGVVTLAPGGTATIHVTFAPTTVGLSSATLSVATSAGTVVVGLSGTGACPNITLSDLSGGTVGTAYSQTVTASAGIGSIVFTVTGGALPPGLTLSSGGQLTGTPTTAGSFDVTITATDANQCSGTRTITVAIARSATSVTWATPAPIVYGTTLTALQLNATASVPGSFVYTPPAGTVFPAGDHPLSVTFTPTDSADFNQSTASVILRVNQAPLTVSADSKARLYGAPNPPLTATISGFVLGENAPVLGGSLVLGTSAVLTSSVGSYPITASGLTSSNYAITFVPGALVIAPATLTVKADDKLIFFGDPLPTLTATLSGFVLGETTTVVSGNALLTTTAVAGSPVGSYPITAAQGSLAAANYVFTFEGGTLTIAGPRAELQAVLADLRQIRLTVSDKQTSEKLDDAIANLASATAAASWIDLTHPATHGKSVFSSVKDAASNLADLIEPGKGSLPSSLIQPLINRIVSASRAIAAIAINDAVTAGGNQKKVDKARGDLARGDSEAASGKAENAIDRFSNAWNDLT